MLLILLLIILISSTTSNESESDQPSLPKFDQSHETVSVVVGKRALLPCYVSLQETKNNGLGSLKVIWMKLNNSSVLTIENRPINGDPRISLLHAYAGEWNLQIDDIDEDDAGIYRCMINNGMYKTLTLEVKVPPKIVDELTTEPYPYPLQANSNFTIKCYAQGKPTPSIRILSYDQSDDHSTNAKVISDQNEVTIHNVSRYTSRRYECIASNGYPPDVARSFQLTVQYPPEVNVFINNDAKSSIFIQNRHLNDIHLKCEVIMHPLGTVYWMKDTNRLNYHSKLYQSGNRVISELTLKHFGNSEHHNEYICVASNTLGMNSKSVQIVVLAPSVATTTTTIATTTMTANVPMMMMMMMTTTTTTIAKTVAVEKVTSKHLRSKHTRTTTVSPSTESLRMMTLSSKGVNHTYHTIMIIILVCSMIHSGLFQIR